MTQGPLFGPQNGNAATSLPIGKDANRYGATQTWVKDSSAPGANDGTVLDAAFFNRIIGSLDYIVQETSTVASLGDFTALYRAIKGLVLSAVANANAKFITLDGADKLVNKTLDTPSILQPDIIGGQAANLTLNTPTINQPNLKGTTIANDAGVGVIGEYLTASQGSVALVSGTAVNVAWVDLTPGDWDVGGELTLNALTGAGVVNWLAASISTTTNTMGVAGTTAYRGHIINLAASSIPNQVAGEGVGLHRINLNANTRVYLVAKCSHAATTIQTFGQIRARRVR